MAKPERRREAEPCVHRFAAGKAFPARKGASAGVLCAHSAGALTRPSPPLLRAAAFVVCPSLPFHPPCRRSHDFFFPFHAFPFPFLPFSCRSFRPVSASVVPAEAMGANGMPLRLMAWMPALPRRNRRRQPAVFACAQTHPKGEGTSAAGAGRPLRRLHHPATPARPPRRLRRPATAARPPHHFRRPQPPPSRPPCLHRPHSPPATGGFCVRANAPKGRRDKRRRRGAPATPSPSPYNPRPSAAPPLA